ncbi:hypothetical protein DPMN_154903 [Dreissena polymorpha]|uniref:Uncharacterized protein n=1 Tax=Dreissena polymorpha TaxID=45954 RepID=A0A9D4BVK0_DREPO|nr:hypothetical protein DPMN_070332 [Dreissena polymorpha]KAH3801256.1 hypothetical protein DPMN_154903 [Dreissena polymorpha]
MGPHFYQNVANTKTLSHYAIPVLTRPELTFTLLDTPVARLDVGPMFRRVLGPRCPLTLTKA